MQPIFINKNVQLMMSLVHYFVTVENYAPIKVLGVSNEIWLENVTGPYRVIRINANNLINEEQYKFDILKMNQIMRQVKKKTLTLKMNALNICLNTSKKMDFKKNKNIDTIKVADYNDLRNNEELVKVFPKIKNNLVETKDQLELIINVTNDINKKTDKENKLFMQIFSKKKIIVTYILILLCTLMYLFTAIRVGSFNLSASDLITYGANNLIYVKNKEFFRILTSAFLHASLIHLILNMYSLYILGSQLENFVGKVKFLIIYIISAICGSLMSLIFMESNVVSVGASGAIFGIIGALLYFGYHYRLYLSSAIKNQLIPIVILNLFIGFMLPSIDNSAHIGGLIAGYLCGMALDIEKKNTKASKLNGSIVLILYVVFLLYVVLFLK